MAVGVDHMQTQCPESCRLKMQHNDNVNRNDTQLMNINSYSDDQILLRSLDLDKIVATSFEG